MVNEVAVAVLGTLLVGAALACVTTRNLVHSVLWLGTVLAGTAALFVMLGAEFLATVQVLLYIGGVVTLLIFGIMLTSRPSGALVSRELVNRPRAAVVALGLFALMVSAIVRTPGLDEGAASQAASTSDLVDVLLGKDLLAFEALSVLLLAAMIGAAVLARPKDFGAPRPAGSARQTSGPRSAGSARSDGETP